MRGKGDEIKGRVEEAAGEVADDEQLERKGKKDKAAGKVKQRLEQLADKAEEVVDTAKERFKR